MALTDDISSRRGMVPPHLLEHAVGILDWVTSAIPGARPWLAMLWAAILRKRDPTKQSTRVRKGLVFVRQVEVATTWLRQLVTEIDSRKGCLSRTYIDGGLRHQLFLSTQMPAIQVLAVSSWYK